MSQDDYRAQIIDFVRTQGEVPQADLIQYANSLGRGATVALTQLLNARVIHGRVMAQPQGKPVVTYFIPGGE